MQAVISLTVVIYVMPEILIVAGSVGVLQLEKLFQVSRVPGLGESIGVPLGPKMVAEGTVRGVFNNLVTEPPTCKVFVELPQLKITPDQMRAIATENGWKPTNAISAKAIAPPPDPRPQRRG